MVFSREKFEMINLNNYILNDIFLKLRALIST
jgi:hypothetical protein